MSNTLMLSPKTNRDIIIEHLTNLNIQGLQESLSDKYSYCDISKKEFLSRLEYVFDKLKEEGTVRLTIRQSICAGCNSGARVLLLVSEETRKFLAFAIDINNEEEVIDLFSCNRFIINHFPDYLNYVHISFDFDNNYFFDVFPALEMPIGK